jgi:hypothetical protein
MYPIAELPALSGEAPDPDIAESDGDGHAPVWHPDDWFGAFESFCADGKRTLWEGAAIRLNKKEPVPKQTSNSSVWGSYRHGHPRHPGHRDLRKEM